jgi:O-antigen/teichoic acid export membrane protein
VTLRGLARGSFLYSIGFLLPRVGAFLLLPIYVSVLSTADYGAIVLVVSVAQLIASVMRMGLDGALMRMHFDSADRQAQNRLIGTVATMTALVAAAGSTLIGLAAWAFFDTVFSGLPFVPYGVIAAILSFTTTFQALPATVLRAREEPGRFLAFSGGAFTVTAATTLLLLVVLRVGVVGALLGQLAGGIFVVLVTVAMVARAGGPSLDRKIAREALAFGLPLVPHTLSGWLLNVSDRWLLNFLLPLSAVMTRAAIGVYSLGYQLAYAIDLLAQSFNSAWVPFFYRYGATPQAIGIHREMTSMVMAGFGALSALLAIHAELVVTVVSRPEFLPAAELIPILTVAFFAHVFYIAVVTVVFYARRTAVLPVITGASAAVNIGSNFFLIPALGIKGAAWATLLAFGFMAIATYVPARRWRLVALDWPRLAVIGVVVVGASAWATWQGRQLSVGRVSLDMLVSIAVVLVALALVVAPQRRLRTLTRAARASEVPVPAGQDPVGAA